MISNQILQSTIKGVKDISRVDLYVADTDGKIVASTSQIGNQFKDAIIAFAGSPADSQSVQGYQFFKVYDENQLELILIAQGANDDVFMIGKMAAFQIQNLLVAYKERFDKDNFIKNLLLDNLLLVDIYNRAKKLHIDMDTRRVVCIIETKNEKDSVALETVRTLFATQKKDFITAVDEKSIILIKNLEEKQGYEDVQKISETIVDMLNTEAMTSAWVAYSNLAEDISRLPDAYKEAHTALEVGKIFYADKNVFGYNQLGIGRLIYQLPVSICEMFIDEIFKEETLDSIDEETLITIRTFFENNLNLSETSRQLYVHRNTLVYRFEKLQRKFGLDIRAFEDALTFKLAMMVVDYIKYSKNHPS